MRLSVIIVNYNTKQLLLQCLKTVFQALKPYDAEVFIIDNASSDFSVEAVEHEFPDCILIRNSKNLGFGKANNQAIKKAKGQYLLILNPDTELSDGCLSSLINYLDLNPKVAVVGPRVLFSDGSHQPSVFKFTNLLTEFVIATFIYSVFKRIPILSKFLGLDWSPNEIREVDYLRGCCLLCRTSAILQVQGFDERYFLYTEEADLQYRIMKNGWKIVFNPNVSIIHHHAMSMDQDPYKTYVELFKSQLQFARKNHSKLYVLSLKVIWVFYHLFRIAIFAPLSYMSINNSYKIKLRKHIVALHYLLSSYKYIHSKFIF